MMMAKWQIAGERSKGFICGQSEGPGLCLVLVAELADWLTDLVPR